MHLRKGISSFIPMDTYAFCECIFILLNVYENLISMCVLKRHVQNTLGQNHNYDIQQAVFPNPFSLQPIG